MLKNNLIIKKKRIFLLTGSNLIKKKNITLFIEKIKKKSHVKLFIKKNFLPNIKELIHIVKEIKDYKPNLIIALGGGSIIDYCKIANAVCHIKNVSSFLDQKVKLKKYTRLLAIPTTIGSGSEVTQGAVMYKNKIKFSLKSPTLLPNNFYLIPSLIVGSNIQIKKSSLFDVVSQSIESLISFKSNKISQKYSLKALKIVLKNYKIFLKKDDIKNIKKMQIAGNFSGRAISITSTGAPHALSYYLSSHFNIPHGLAVMTYLPIILKFNLENKEKLPLDKKKNFEYRVGLLKKVFHVKSEIGILDSINKIIKNAEFKNSLKSKKINFEKLKKSINISRLKNNPVPIDFFDIKKINKDIF